MTTFLEIGNTTQEKGQRVMPSVQRKDNFPALPEIGLFEHCITQQDVTCTLSQAVIRDTKSASFFLCVIG